jgi:glycosyltransferase involved in cell wall biosynthesis
MKNSVSLVLETNNLHGGAGTVDSTLAELLVHLRGQTFPLSSLAELVVTHEGLADAAQRALERAAGRSITFVRLPPGTGYYAAKNRGFEKTTAEVVVFGDGDCWPDPAWLDALASHFDDEAVRVVAGRTSYRGDLLGTAATTIDFMYFGAEGDSSRPEGARGSHARTRNFYANNVAFRRGTFERARYVLDDAFYRGNCQVLGLLLQETGVPIVFEPRARTTHRLPDSRKDFARLRLLRGADAVALTPHLARAYLPRPLRRLAEVPGLEALVLGSRLLFSVRSINRQDMPPVHGTSWLACAGLTAAISALDAAGACLQRAGLMHLVAKDEPMGNVALAYHDDVDALSNAFTTSKTPAPAR